MNPAPISEPIDKNTGIFPAVWKMWFEKLFRKLTKYESAQQTITAAGALTLAHGLREKPTLVTAVLVCQTGEFNYTAGDEVFIALGAESTAATDNWGVMVVPDATNLNVRFGSSANVFLILNKTTGATQTITLANWKIVFRAWTI